MDARIHEVQGPGLFSPLAGRTVTTGGVVTGATRKGFFIQDPDGDPSGAASHGLFVFARGDKPPRGRAVVVTGRVVDYQQEENARPTTQLEAESVRISDRQGPPLEPIWLTAAQVLIDPDELAAFLNRREGMLVGIAAGAVFVAPSNSYGDYVVAPVGAELRRTRQGGVLIDPAQPGRWLPGFRITEYAHAPVVNVGAELLEAVTGPLNFRADSFQIASAGPIRVRQKAVKVRPTTLRPDSTHVTVLTLNGFNLDAQVEDPARVKDPRRDVDDDVRDGRFAAFGRTITREAATPSIVALQEIQDDDGAEITVTVTAGRTLDTLVEAVRQAGGPAYEWLEIPPVRDADGGQPGGNIRNTFLYDPAQVAFVAGSLHRLGADAPEFTESRKPLVARFTSRHTGHELEVINVHLASKRHQNGLFAPQAPGFDSREDLRVGQAELIGAYLASLRAEEVDYYVTGDFNDFEFSRTLRALTADHSVDLVETVPEPLRFDYNHRGISQALMHGVVSRRQLAERAAAYEILHANALLGSVPGRSGDKASDHGYVVARFKVG